MIVKSGREYIVKNGFSAGNIDKNKDTITKIIFGDSDEVSEEENNKESLGNEIIISETAPTINEDNYYYYKKDKNGEDIKFNADGTDASIKTKDACNFESKKVNNTTFLFKIRLNRCRDKEDPKKISCMGLFNGDTLIARVVFPPIYKRNETELNLNYTLYF